MIHTHITNYPLYALYTVLQLALWLFVCTMIVLVVRRISDEDFLALAAVRFVTRLHQDVKRRFGR